MVALLSPTTEATPAADDGQAQAQQRRRAMAFVLCDRAENQAAWLMADRLCVAWELGGCAGVGVEQPTEGRR